MENGKMAAPLGQPSQAPYWVAVGVLVLAGVLLLTVAGFKKGGGLLSGTGAGSTDALPQMASLRTPCPEFSLKRIGGEEALSQGETEGRVTVLHFWASWCPPCRSEFPEFARYASKAQRDGLRVVAISLDADPSVAQDWAVANGQGIPIWTQGDDLAGALGVTGIPATILLDRNGRIAMKAQGAQSWSESGVPRQVEALLSE